jgi:hypothetical protein
MDTLRTLARLLTPQRTAQARFWQRQAFALEEAERTRDVEAFARDFATTPGGGRILLGRGTAPDGRHFWAGMEPGTLLGNHAWWVGASGAGKTYGVIAVCLQLLRLLPRFVLVVVDLKGELVPLLRTVIAGLPNVGELLPHVYAVSPFGDGEGRPAYLPCLNITKPKPGLPKEIQALTITGAISTALASDLGIRMERLAQKMVALAIALDEPLTRVIDWLQTPARFAAAARRSGDRELIGYALHEFPRENPSSILALSARLDAFTIVGDTKLVLNASRCVAFPDILSAPRAICLVSLGQPPAGAERLQRFWSNLVISDLTRAILTRRVTASTSPVLLVLEEFQEALDTAQAAAFGRLLSLARFKKTAVWLVNQSPAQVSRVDASLVRLLHANVGLQFLFRTPIEDARALAHALPAVSAKDPEGGRQGMIEEISRLPRRHLFFWDKTHRAVFLRSPRLDLEAITRAAAAAPSSVHDALARGVCTEPRSVLEARLAASRQESRAQLPPSVPVVIPADDGPFPRIG